MNKPTTILLLILTILSCQEKKELNHISHELKGKTFDAINVRYKYPLAYDFQDSTYRVYGIDTKKRPFKTLKTTDSINVFLDSEKSKVTKSLDNQYDYLIVINNIDSLKLKQRKAQWKSEMIYGNWIESKPNVTETDSLPIYSITENQINYNHLSKKLKSEIDINDTFEFINMNLIQSKKRSEINWRIISVTDSTMLIDKTFNDNDLRITTHYNIKLEKKR